MLSGCCNLEFQYLDWKFSLDTEDLLIAVVGGGYGFGFYTEHSDLDVRGIRVPTKRELENVKHVDELKSYSFVSKKDGLDIKIRPFQRWLPLRGGNWDNKDTLFKISFLYFLEDFFYQTSLFPSEDSSILMDEIIALQQVIKNEVLSKDLGRMYLKTAEYFMSNNYTGWSIHRILKTYKFLLGGIVILQKIKIIPKLFDDLLNENIIPSETARQVLNVYPLFPVDMLGVSHPLDGGLKNKIVNDHTKLCKEMKRQLRVSRIRDEANWEALTIWLNNKYEAGLFG